MKRFSGAGADALSPGADRRLWVIAAIGLWLVVCNPLALLGERIGLVRYGVMVDPSFCDCSGIGSGFRDIDTRYFKVSFDKDVDLGAVDRQLRKRFFFPGRDVSGYPDPASRIAARLDAICERAMDILDMRPRLPKSEIRIFKTRADVGSAYRVLTGKPGEYKAFHIRDCKMIYTSEADISDSVIAHEIAHAIVDAHYDGIPPPDVGEMLASYVDMHLSD